MGRYSFDQNLFRYFAQMERKYYARPLNLGGSNTGAGSPAGGFIGYLPQDRVSYDTIELESDAVPASGISLVDNMNHIRYRLAQLELGVSSAGIYVEEDDVLVASGVIYLNFEGGVNVTDDGSNQVTVTISGSITDEQVKVSANDTTANYLLDKLNAGTNIAITELGDGGNEQVQVGYTGITTDEFTKVSDNDSTPGYLDGKLIAGTYITLTQVLDGGDEQLQINCTASGISGPDELIKVSSDDTTAEYLDTKIIAGTGITINTLYPGLNEQLEITASGLDKLVKVSSNDTTADYLYDKLVAGSGITLTELDDGGVETLRITSTVVASGGTFDDIFPLITPVSGDFSWVNQVDATVSTIGSKMILYDPANADLDWHLFVKNIPTAPYKVTIGFIPSSYGDFGASGLVLYDSSGGSFIHYSMQYRSGQSGITPSICAMTDLSHWLEDYSYLTQLGSFFAPMIWLQIEDDTTDRFYRYSFDGLNFRQLYTDENDVFVVPNKIGFGISSYGSSEKVWATVLHYSEE